MDAGSTDLTPSGQPKPIHSLLTEAAQNAIVSYSTNPVVRATMAAIPFVAGLDALIGTAGFNMVIDRLSIAFEELGQVIRAHEERLDQSVTQDDVQDVAIKALRTAVETGNRGKRRDVIALLVGATLSPRPDGLDFEAVLNAIGNLTPGELDLAREIYDGTVSEPISLTDGMAVGSAPHVDFHLQRLVGAGLIYETQVLRERGGEPSMEPRYGVTETFRSAMVVIRHGGKAPLARPVAPC